MALRFAFFSTKPDEAIFFSPFVAVETEIETQLLASFLIRGKIPTQIHSHVSFIRYLVD
jgi:hypothetical protein